MKIKLLIARASSTGAQNVGDEVDVSNAEAQRMIEAGTAVPVRDVKPEKAISRAKPERASK